MKSILNYNLTEKLHESPYTLAYRALSEDESSKVVLKILNQEYPDPQTLRSFREEYELTRELDLNTSVKALSLKDYNNSLLMVLEEFPGLSLNHHVNEGGMDLPTFLDLAEKIAGALGEIHNHRIIHKDINPSNILWDPKTAQIRIIDFGLATRLNQEHSEVRNPSGLEGTLTYISPEQTGRMNRNIDYRTDLYSLGITYYEILLGKPPFQSDDTLELVHMHIAKIPLSPHVVTRNVPPVVSKIIMKLLEKTAEHRYQSAFALQEDLRRCAQELKSKGKIETFEIAKFDISDRFQIPETILGRESELDILLAAFERVSKGAAETLLISGYSGIGKSALVNEIHRPITGKKGNFTSGKFDQLKKDIPYSALLQAYKGILQTILSGGSDELELWKEKLSSALGPNGQLIIDVLPELELIIGPRPEMPELPPAESRNRFNLVLDNFTRAFCTKEHPLVIFLDDLQWADESSLKMIKSFATNSEMKYLLIIGTYRDNETSDTHPLIITLDEINTSNAVLNKIQLTTLGLESIKSLIAQTIHQEPEMLDKLAHICLQKTGGNPFFLNQFLDALHKKGLLKLNEQKRRWDWDAEKIKATPMTDNVIELMSGKILTLPESAQKVLQNAACIGAEFDLTKLEIVMDLSSDKVEEGLSAATQSGLIYEAHRTSFKSELTNTQKTNAGPLGRNIPLHSYRFLHDRVQQAAYAMLDDSEKQQKHLKIGRLMLKHQNVLKQEKKLFEIATHLNHGSKLISNQTEKYELALLNLEAARQAKKSAAFEPSFRYIQAALNLLQDSDWENQHELSLDVHILGAETAYLAGYYDDLQKLSAKILEKSNDVLVQVQVYQIEIESLSSRNEHLAAVPVARKAFRLLGIYLPEKVTLKHLIIGSLKTKIALMGKKIESLADMPEMQDPIKRAALKLLHSFQPVAWTVAPEYLPLIIFNSVPLSARYGATPWAASAYAAYGFSLCGIMGDIENGYRFGKMSLKLLDRFGREEMRASTYTMFYGSVTPYKEHVRETLVPLSEGYQSGLDTGDLLFASINAQARLGYLFVSGMELGELEAEISKYIKAMVRLRMEHFVNYFAFEREVVRNLRNAQDKPDIIKSADYDEDKMLPIHLKKNDHTALFTYYSKKSILQYMFEKNEDALETSIEGEKYKESMRGTMIYSVYVFYDTLIRIKAYETAAPSEKKLLRKRINVHRKQMKIWSFHNEMNYLHKHLLLEAEYDAELEGGKKAVKLYENSIRHAQENDFIQDVALANELAALYYNKKNISVYARAHFRESLYAYKKWGAETKIKQLINAFPNLVGSQKEDFEQKTSVRSHTTGNYDLDLKAVMKAAQVISGEIKLDILLKKLITIVLENAGAQRAFLFLYRDGELSLEAEAESGEDHLYINHSKSLKSLEGEGFHRLPFHLIQFVARTKKHLVLDNAAQEAKFQNDPYIKNTKPLSVLCTPILHQGNLTGLLYMENNLSTGAFTADLLEVLNLLSSQLAISLQNAQLYANLEEKVHERTLELKETQEKLVELEKEATERQMAGGFAHEIRNALAGSKLVLDSALGMDVPPPHQSINLSNSRKLKEIYFLLKENVADDLLEKILALMKEIFTNETKLDKILELVHRATTRGLAITSQIMNYSSLGQKQALIEAVNIDKLILEIVKDSEAEFRKGNVLLETELPGDTKIMGTAAHFHSIIKNLINNAYDALIEGNESRSGTDNGRIKISAESINQLYILRIADNGAGIPGENIDKIFDAFFSTKPGSGTGLGLGVVKKIVNMYGGSIDLETKAEKGTTFIIQLPLNKG